MWAVRTFKVNVTGSKLVDCCLCVFHVSGVMISLRLLMQ